MRAVKNGIEKEFGAQVAVTSESTPDTSGALEVQIVGGRMLHTKLGGQGTWNLRIFFASSLA